MATSRHLDGNFSLAHHRYRLPVSMCSHLAILCYRETHKLIL